MVERPRVEKGSLPATRPRQPIPARGSRGAGSDAAAADVDPPGLFLPNPGSAGSRAVASAGSPARDSEYFRLSPGASPEQTDHEAKRG